MALETGTFIDDLITSNPPGGDQILQGDDHLRLIKTVLKNTFPNADRALYFAGAQTKVGDYAIVEADENDLIMVDATATTRTITMPDGSTLPTGWTVHVMKIDAVANNVTVDGNGADTLNGAADRTLNAQYEIETYLWDGAEWKVMAVTDLSAYLLITTFNSTGTHQGEHALPLIPSAFRPTAVNGAAQITDVAYAGGNNLPSISFDPAADQHIYFTFRAPKSSDETAGFFIKGLGWSAASGSGDVMWEAGMYSFGDGENLNTGIGAGKTMLDTLNLADDINIAPDSTVITPGGTWTEGDFLTLRIKRRATDVADTLGADARFHGCHLIITTNAANDV